MFRVEFQFPRSRRGVLVPVDERGGVPALRKREVLDVDSGIGQIEVGPVLALLGGRGVVLVGAARIRSGRRSRRGSSRWRIPSKLLTRSHCRERISWLRM